MQFHRRFVTTLVVCALSAGSVVAADSPLAGSYAGRFTFRSANPRFPNAEGNVTLLTITADGRLTGKCTGARGEPAEFNGTVDEDGAVRYSIEFSTQTYVVKGIITKTKRGTLKGSLTQYEGRDLPVGNVEFDLPPK
jgi:hypothetical protein